MVAEVVQKANERAKTARLAGDEAEATAQRAEAGVRAA